MSPSDLEAFKRALQALGYEHKTHLSYKEIDRLIEELNLNRDYQVADYIRSLDPASIANLLRH